MKRVSFVLAAMFAFSALAVNAAGTTKISGYISDSMCGAKHAGSGSDCVKKCIESGMKPVFVDDKKVVWAIDNPDSVKNFYGDKVTVTATADSTAKSVHISDIQAAK